MLPDDYYDDGVTQMLRKGCTVVIIRRQKCRAFPGIIPRVARKTRGMRSARLLFRSRKRENCNPAISETMRLYGLLVSGTCEFNLVRTCLSMTCKTVLAYRFDENSAIVISVKVGSSFNRRSATWCFQGKYSVFRYRIAFIMWTRARTKRVKHCLESRRAYHENFLEINHSPNS